MPSLPDPSKPAGAAPFVRKAPPFANPLVRLPLQLPVYLIGVPFFRALDLTGLMRPFLRRFGTRINPNVVFSERFNGYIPTERDVLVCVYTKSGTNWTMQIAHQIAWRGAGEYAHIHDVIPWPDAMVESFAIPLDSPDPLTASPTGLRVIKTHLEREFVPFNDQARYITVLRDPKDIFLSNFYFLKGIMWGPMMPSLDTWLDHFLSPQFMLGSWARHTAGYWQVRQRPNMLVLTFKEMKADLPGTVRKVADFMGVALKQSEFEMVCKKSSFEYMRSIDDRFHPGLVTPWSDPRGRMMRRGERGESRRALSAQQRRRIDDYARQELADLGSDFPFDAYFGEGE